MAHFKNYAECKKVIESFLDDFPPESRDRIESAIIRAKSYSYEKNKIFLVLRTFQNHFWQISNEQLSIRQWMDINFKERLEAIEYHEKYGDEDEG